MSKFFPTLIWLLFGLTSKTLKTVSKLNFLLIGPLILNITLLPFMALTWTLKFLNIKIAESGIILFLCVNLIVLDAKNTMVPINWRIIEIWHSVANPISNSILFILKYQKKYPILILSSTQTVKINTKLITTYTPFKNTNLTKDDIIRNSKSFIKLEPILSVYLWTALSYAHLNIGIDNYLFSFII